MQRAWPPEYYRPRSLGRRLFKRFLYYLTLTSASALGLMLLLAPLLANGPNGDVWERLCYLFGEDVILRKTAVVSMLGLWVTAVAFFRPRPRFGRRYRDYADPVFRSSRRFSNWEMRDAYLE